MPAACHWSHWAGEGGRYGSGHSVTHEVAPSTRCYRRINYSRRELSGGTMGCLQTLQVLNNTTLSDGVPAKETSYCL